MTGPASPRPSHERTGPRLSVRVRERAIERAREEGAGHGPGPLHDRERSIQWSITSTRPESRQPRPGHGPARSRRGPATRGPVADGPREHLEPWCT